jgi:IQ calmodulin-binding motif
MMGQDLDMSPRTKASNASVRRAKIEKMKMDHSATTIQALWRGAVKRRAYKKRLQRNGKLLSKQRISDMMAAPIELKNIRPEPIQPKPTASSARSTLASSSRRLHESQRDDDDDGCLERDDMDDEEALAISAAEHFEERLIRLASLRNLQPTWPDALLDNFDDPDWPELDTATSTLGERNYVSFVDSLSHV